MPVPLHAPWFVKLDNRKFTGLKTYNVDYYRPNNSNKWFNRNHTVLSNGHNLNILFDTSFRLSHRYNLISLDSNYEEFAVWSYGRVEVAENVGFNDF